MEIIFHALVQCRVATMCWKIFDPGINTETTMDFSAWLQGKLEPISKRDKARMIILCWGIWRARNDVVWNNRRQPALKIIAKTWEYLTQWIVALERVTRVPTQPHVMGDGAIYWEKP
ncbi:uncharacterized protein LOC141701494 [Apium graveolens]|uniref:uncharacterized protein LOC141701494 n=1 Tax=Apium graveolens TaxID=4045 RepID=UPI003D7AFC34